MSLLSSFRNFLGRRILTNEKKSSLISRNVHSKFPESRRNPNVGTRIRKIPIPKKSKSVGGDWRKSQGMAINASSYGPLTDLPDYTFLDGRPTPTQAGKLRRAEKNMDITEKILRLTNEMDIAVNLSEEKTKEEDMGIQNILNRKLRPKGTFLEKGSVIVKNPTKISI